MSAQVIDDRGHVMPLLRMATVQNVSIAGTAAASSAFGEGVQAVRLVATTRTYVLMRAPGVTTAATTSNAALLEIGIPEIFAVQPGGSLSAIQASAGGALNVVELR